MRIIYLLLCLIAIPGVFIAWKDTLLIAFSQSQTYLPLIMGAGIYFMFMGIRNQASAHNFKWFQVFSHELTHTIFSILTFNRIHGFKATSHSGGYVAYQGNTNMLILLSPYCIPIFTLLAVGLGVVFSAQNNPYFIGVLSFTYVFHLHTFISQAQGFQPDLRAYGLLPSYTFIILLNMLMMGIIIGSITSNFVVSKDFLWTSWEHTYNHVMYVWNLF